MEAEVPIVQELPEVADAPQHFPAPPLLGLIKALFNEDRTPAARRMLLAKFFGDTTIVPEDAQPEVRSEEELAQRAFGFVIRMINIQSAEKKTAPAQAAIRAEIDGLVKLGVFDIDSPQEYDDVCAAVPDATFLRGFMLIGEKGQELAPSQRRWKGRLVGGGDQVRNVRGERVYSTAHHLVPTSLTALQLTLGYGLVPGGETFFGDVEAAYTKAPLPGPPCYLELEPSLRPESWRRLGLRRPVMLLKRALYGHPLAGAAWNTLLAQWLLTHSWERVADAGEDSLYVRRYAMR